MWLSAWRWMPWCSVMKMETLKYVGAKVFDRKISIQTFDSFPNNSQSHVSSFLYTYLLWCNVEIQDIWMHFDCPHKLDEEKFVDNLSTNTCLLLITQWTHGSFNKTKKRLKMYFPNFAGVFIQIGKMQGCRNCWILPSQMGEHGVSLENTGNMKNMENMENINRMTQKSPELEDFWRRKGSLLLLMFKKRYSLYVCWREAKKSLFPPDTLF